MRTVNSRSLSVVRTQMFCKYLNNIQYEGPAIRCRFWLLIRKMNAKYINNQQREGRLVNGDINRITVVNPEWITLTYVLVDDEDATFARIVGKTCKKRKRQPWIVSVYRSLERQIYCNYWNNIQCEGPSVRCRFWSFQRKMYAK